MDSFVYKWINLTLNKIYIGFHKGNEDDGYICSSRSLTFWEEYDNPEYEWKREILFRGTMSNCQLLESQLLNELDITSDYVYNNKNNLMFNLNDEVRMKLKTAAHKRQQNPEYVQKQRERTKKQWENPEFRKKMVVINTGKNHSADTIQKIKESRAKQIITSESRLKAAEKLKNIPRSQNIRNAISIARTNAPEVTCPHCGKLGKFGGSMSRWHFDNCKLKGLK